MDSLLLKNKYRRQDRRARNTAAPASGETGTLHNRKSGTNGRFNYTIPLPLFQEDQHWGKSQDNSYFWCLDEGFQALHHFLWNTVVRKVNTLICTPRAAILFFEGDPGSAGSPNFLGAPYLA